jgi:hypothetical protein
MASIGVCPSGPLGLICHVGLGGVASGAVSVAPAAVGAAAGSVLDSVAHDMASSASSLLKTLSTFWMNVDTPRLDGSGTPVSLIQADTSWIVTSAAVVCILVAAARLAIRRRGQPAAVLMLGLTRLVVVSTAATFLVEAAGKLGDSFSSDVMRSAHIGSGWASVINVTAASNAIAGGGVGLLLVIALLVIFASLIQLMLMILRVGLLVILTGTLPLAAAASMSEWGESWWRKHLGWLTAWLLYKPAAALLFAAAFRLTQGSASAVEALSGIMLLLLSVLTLPALLRLIVPMTASLGAASGGAFAMGAAGAIATGAVKVAGTAASGGATAATGAATAKGTGANGKAGAPSGSSVQAGARQGASGQGSPPGSPAHDSERTVVPPSSSGNRGPGQGAPAAGATASDSTPPPPGSRTGTAPSGSGGSGETSNLGPSGASDPVDDGDRGNGG